MNPEEERVIRAWEADDRDFFNRFTEEYQKWPVSGKEPQGAGQDVRHYLDLQQKRITQHGLQLKLQLDPFEVPPIAAYKVFPALYRDRIQRSLVYRSYHLQKEWKRKGKSLLREKGEITLYQTLISADVRDERLANTEIVCPSCGAAVKIRELEEGCQYCGTHYVMQDLFPKVIDLYTLPTPGNEERIMNPQIRRWCFSGAGIMVLFALFTAFSNRAAYTEALAYAGLAFALLFAAAGGAFLGYLAYSFSLLIGLFGQLGESLPLAFGAWGSQKKVRQELMSYDPSFTYEYLQGKAMSLLRNVLFEKDPLDSALYQGAPLDPSFTQLVDIAYRGALNVEKVEKEAESLAVTLRLYLLNTYDRGERLEEKKEVLHMRMVYAGKPEEEPLFRVQRVRCPSCGSSYDSAYAKRCPSCGSRNEFERTGWTVTEIRR